MEKHSVLKTKEKIMDAHTSESVGSRKPIREAVLKVTGEKRYVGDMRLMGMLHAKVLFSPLAHAKIKHIDISKAEALPGVYAVATYKNTPNVKYNSALRFMEHNIPKTERIFDDTVRFVGDKVAAVAAETPEIAKKALQLIEVEYEELPYVLDIEAATKEGAYPIHEGGNIAGKAQVSAGDTAKAFEESDYVFEDKYTMPPIHHAAIENHVAIADWSRDNKLTVYSPCQNTFGYRSILSEIFELPYNKVRMVSPAIGGAFGGKLEMTVEPIAAVLSKLSGKPVKLEYTRRESIISTRVRHGAINHVKAGFMKDGTITALEFKVYTNTGAYASSALNVTGAMSHKVFKAYKVDNISFTAYPVYTNTPVAGAMRGYGSPQAYFGLERQLNKIANFLGLTQAQLYQKNMVDPDSLDPCFKKPHGNPRPKDCLNKVLEASNYQKLLEEQLENKEKFKNEAQRYKVGIGLALGVHGNNCFGAHRDVSTLMLKMNEDGSCILYTGSHDMGNDNVGMQMQIISKELGISLEKIDVVTADTDACLWHLGDYASRGTYVVGAAALSLSQLMKKELIKEASEVLSADIDDIMLEDDKAICSSDLNKRVSLKEVMLHCQRDSMRELCISETYAAFRGASSYGVHLAKVRVDTHTGEVRVLDYYAAHDVGHVINPLMIEGQLEGGVHMGLGYALCEEIIYDEAGQTKNSGFRSYKLIDSNEMPKIKSYFIAEAGGEPGGPYGAKSMGECPVVPVAPAVVNAISNAIGVEIDDLPANPERILAAIRREANYNGKDNRHLWKS